MMTTSPVRLNAPTYGEPDTHLSGRWLRFARVAWLVVVIPSLALFVLGLPHYYQQLHVACSTTATCYTVGSLPAKELQALSTSGLSVSAYAAILTIFSLLSICIWGGVGIVIFWRRSDDWLALLGAFGLVLAGVSEAGSPAYTLSLINPVFLWSFSFVSFLGQLTLGAYFLFFPSGRLVPRWLWPFLLLGIAYAFFNNFPTPAASFDETWPEGLFTATSFTFTIVPILAQIYRYWRVSTSVQRQQTKWIVLGVAVAFGTSLLFLVAAILNPALPPNILFDEAWTLSFSAGLLLIPIAFGFSILRYRLYDIDLIINRTLVYGSLTAILAAIYFACVLGAQAITRALALTDNQQSNPIVIVLSTLLIAALFQPVRRGIQRVIDRRFFRRKYDAVRTLERFAATLRSETDLPHLAETLIGVVSETMQPAHISLWLQAPTSVGPANRPGTLRAEQTPERGHNA